MDREEFFRLKKVQGKKKKDTAAREEEDQKRRDAEDSKNAPEATDLGIEKDEDGKPAVSARPNNGPWLTPGLNIRSCVLGIDCLRRIAIISCFKPKTVRPPAWLPMRETKQA